VLLSNGQVLHKLNKKHWPGVLSDSAGDDDSPRDTSDRVERSEVLKRSIDSKSSESPNDLNKSVLLNDDLLPHGYVGVSLAATGAGHAVVLAKRDDSGSFLCFVRCCFGFFIVFIVLGAKGVVFVWRRGRFEQVFDDAKTTDKQNASFISVACGKN